ncbi:bifunctional diguanylate cyclase/phosphodiesterase [Isoptericola sp. b490]|uniref:putative bifunctional diguanylate cyclase/phosphodiesterase n=1 Tax=Actinotalea lenta TaxID=3064654 RepID=UPI0027136356|nr:bifunctional diguanylate cyclase/phosphodiesterase [Isoptericola sp. b490]MDO8122539.1 bifunctional diguanylate cyclase/phosphodiesterase [Isoptericola sp. b490]
MRARSRSSPYLSLIASLLVAAWWMASWGGVWLVGAEALALGTLTVAHLQVAFVARRSGRRRADEPWEWLSSANGLLVVATALRLVADAAALLGRPGVAGTLGHPWVFASQWGVAAILMCRGLARWGRNDTGASVLTDWLNVVGAMLVTLAALGTGTVAWTASPPGSVAGLAQVAAGVTLAAAAGVLAFSAWQSRWEPAWWVVLLVVVAGLAGALGGLLPEAPGAHAWPVLAWAMAAAAMAAHVADTGLRRRHTPVRTQAQVALGVLAAGVVLVALDRVRAAWSGPRAWVPTPGPVWPTMLATIGTLGLSVGLVLTVRDLTLLAHVRRDALTDDLTGLANRRSLLIRLAAPPVRGWGLVLVTVDTALADVNARDGHGAGDRVVAAVARTLTATAPRGAMVARVGGSEFAVLVDNAEARAVDVAADLAAALAGGVPAGGRPVPVAARFGVAVGSSAVPPGEMLRRAAAAVPPVGRPGAVVAAYTDRLDQEHARRFAQLDELHHELEGARPRHADSFVVHFQPQVSVRDGAVMGAEALVRWSHPRQGLVPPGAFLDLVESDGLMPTLTWHVLRTAAEAAVGWARLGAPLRVSVNVSASVLTDARLLPALDAVIEVTGLDPALLVLEITETTLMSDPERGMAAAHAISDRGVGLSIDDYGTGYSSLAYLNDLPADELKIDMSFTRRLRSDPRTRKIVAATVDLAHSLDLRVVAEGVEDPETLDVLATLGCDGSQGYLHSPPVPHEDLVLWLADAVAQTPGCAPRATLLGGAPHQRVVDPAVLDEHRPA